MWNNVVNNVVDRSRPANGEDTASIPGVGGLHKPRNSWAGVPNYRTRSRACELRLLKRLLRNEGSRHEVPRSTCQQRKENQEVLTPPDFLKVHPWHGMSPPVVFLRSQDAALKARSWWCGRARSYRLGSLLTYSSGPTPRGTRPAGKHESLEPTHVSKPGENQKIVLPLV
ncbi:hypothetical protein JEQ12_006652 [Ovis aries]|uniref:Uncharacterized protein n=1 Tax=Ovis aries TaxID=9940 RepID=A0A835ZST4_SHEEP|nr:hypothetical protein JEQ12_006652 [Ovis aries]